MPDEGSSSMPATATTLKQRKGKMLAPIDTTTLCRSNRTNKYDGFRVSATSEARPVKSKVKPRVIPAALEISEDAIPAAPTPTASSNEDATPALPPPTPIATLQAIGTGPCKMAPHEVSSSALQYDSFDE